MQCIIINCSHHAINQIPELICLLIESLYILITISPFLLPQILSITSPFCYLVAFLDATCESIYYLYPLTYFTQYNAQKMHPCGHKWQVSFCFMAKDIALHNMFFSIHLPIDRYLGSFHVLVVVNNASVTMRVQAFSLNIHSEVGLWDRLVGCFVV